MNWHKTDGPIVVENLRPMGSVPNMIMTILSSLLVFKVHQSYSDIQGIFEQLQKRLSIVESLNVEIVETPNI